MAISKKKAAERMKHLMVGGNVDLLNRPRVKSQSLVRAGWKWDGYCIHYYD